MYNVDGRSFPTVIKRLAYRLNNLKIPFVMNENTI